MGSRHDETIRKNFAVTEICIFSLILVSLILNFRLIFLLNIDVDEFSFLASVYNYVEGRLNSPLFSFHVHFFSWLPALPGGEVSQIFAARQAMYFLEIGTCTLLYFTGRLFFTRIGALFSVLCYLSVSNVMAHGTSFRFDPICVFLFHCVVYLIMRKSRSRIPLAAAGLSMAISFLVTLKSVFFLAPLAGIFTCKIVFSEKRSDDGLDLATFLFSFVFGSIALFLYHAFTLSGADPSVLGKNLVHLSRFQILFAHFFPEKYYVFQAVAENMVPLFFLLAGISILSWEIIGGKNLPGNFSLLCLLAPLVSLAFYEFSFPYFYVFILSPGVLVAGVLPDRMAEKYRQIGSKKILICLITFYVAVFIGFLSHYENQSFDGTISQKKIIRTVHEIFPEPVPYIDRCFMIPSFPMVGIQMTTWDMESYSKANRPIMRDLLITKQPVFLLANITNLNLSMPRGTGRDIFRVDPLLVEDFEVLKDNFIHHWGIMYVAGKRLGFDLRDKTRKFENLISGIYTIESEGEVWIDHVPYRSGDKIRLETKTYTVSPRTIPAEVVLRWGRNLYRPADPPPTQPVFYGYYYRHPRRDEK